MLRIYDVSLDVLRDVRGLADEIARYDRDQARQLRRSSVSVTLNLAEGSGSRGGTRRARYDNALGSARETLANLQAAEAVAYIDPIDAALRARLDQVIGTLVNVVR
jgi:four helix bundle protein